MKVRRGNGGSKASTASVSSEATSDSLELDEVLEFPEYSPINYRVSCPKYSLVVDGKMDVVTLEEIDPLQLELETLLVCVVQRKQHLRAQLEALDHDDSLPLLSAGSKKTEGSSVITSNAGNKTQSVAMSPSPTPSGSSSTKRSRPSDSKSSGGKSAKKMKEQKPVKKSGSVSTSSSNQQMSFGIEAVTESVLSTSETPIAAGPALAKNDTPNRFWAYLDEYCRDISDEQIQVVHEMLEAQDAIKTSDYVKVPPLGKHYTIKWAHDDLTEEQKEASDGSSKLSVQDIEKLLRKTAKESICDERYGTLTQRLVSCLLEENLLSRCSDDLPIVSSGNTTTSHGKNTTCSVASIEQRIRKELEELGVMEALAEKVAEQDDEIFLELRKCQSQLLTISAQNVRMLRKLMASLQKRRVEQDAERRLRAIDVEIMEHFRKRRSTARPSRTSSLALPPPSKREREVLEALLAERANIMNQLSPVDHCPFGSP